MPTICLLKWLKMSQHTTFVYVLLSGFLVLDANAIIQPNSSCSQRKHNMVRWLNLAEFGNFDQTESSNCHYSDKTNQITGINKPYCVTQPNSNEFFSLVYKVNLPLLFISKKKYIYIILLI